jgi:DivIVA domain-containing protein
VKKRKKKALELETGLEPGGELRKPLTAADIQKKVFRQEFRGYHRQDVDVFLDQLTEDYAALSEEVRRLREGGAAGADLSEAHAEAQEILRKARAEADALRAGAGASPAEGAGSVSAFLSMEKEFLRGLAEMISRHAEAVRDRARGSRPAAAPAPPGTAGPAAARAPAPESPESARPPSPAAAAAESPPRVVPPLSPSGERGILDIGSGAAQATPPREDSGQETQPALAVAAEGTEEDDQQPAPKREQRTLRELFWGEE